MSKKLLKKLQTELNKIYGKHPVEDVKFYKHRNEDYKLIKIDNGFCEYEMYWLDKWNNKWTLHRLFQDECVLNNWMKEHGKDYKINTSVDMFMKGGENENEK